jgi:HPt (histidine-containing phosphotransfer) domain-containing protein
MGNNSTNLNYQLVTEMAEGDKEFEAELLDAIINSVQDLRDKYILGLEGKDEEKIVQARHKIKPTLSLFALDRLTQIIEEGKQIIESEGIGSPSIAPHRDTFLAAVEDLLGELTGIQQ